MRFKFDAAQLNRAPLKAAPLSGCPCEGRITFGAPASKPPPCPNHYVIENQREAWRRVLWSNPTPQRDRSSDLLGNTGHIERANAWTHLVACVVFGGYALARVWLIEQHTFAAQLSGLAINVSALTFATSVAYHVFGTVPGCGGYMRNLDHVAIYLSMAVSCAADAAFVTNDFAGVPAQCLADPMLAATVLGTFFMVRRFLLPPDETRQAQFEDSCELGLYRFLHSDLEHAGLRTGGITMIVVQWVLLLPAAFSNLSPEVAGLYVAGRFLGTSALIAGVIFDNALLPDKALAGKEAYWDRSAAACGCASKELGCAMNAHAWWHVISLIAAIILTASREYGVSQMSH